MRYGDDITKRIVKELEVIPNVRYVCNKVGIDHSTFYRWIMRHPTFNKKVLMALFVGREAINGSAETVIIKGVQRGEHKSATFWLSHNDSRYMQKEKGKHYSSLLTRDSDIVNKPVEKGHNFETMFSIIYDLEKNFEADIAYQIFEPFIKVFCNDEQNLIDIFYASYKEWKIDIEKEKAVDRMMDPDVDKDA
jgi:hypothetical protein